MNVRDTRPRPSVARRLASGTANIILPVKETGWVVRAVRHMFRSHRQRLSDAFPGEAEEKVPVQLSWAEAISASGCSPAQLGLRYARQMRRWRITFWCLLSLSVLLLGMLLHAGPLPTITLLRLLMTLFCLIACSGYCATRTLIATYRLWQVQEKRVSFAEQGTFRDFLNARQGWRPAFWQALTAKSEA